MAAALATVELAERCDNTDGIALWSDFTRSPRSVYHGKSGSCCGNEDLTSQQVLHKKNGEMEELRARYESKLREQEETIARLEKKVQTIVKDSALVRESKDQQIAELRSLTDDSVATRQNEFERRLHDLVAEHERDQFELQKQHTRVIQELSDEAAARVARLEADYKRQLGAAGACVRSRT